MPSLPLTDALRAFVASQEIPGAALRFRRRGRLVESAEVGWANIAESAPISARSIFRLASLTKPIVAVAVLQLVESGMARLDDPVSVYLPAFAETTVAGGASTDWATAPPERPLPVVPAQRSITLRDLLTHSSGLGQGPNSDRIVREGSHDAETLAERVDRYATIPADAQPGEIAGYSPQVGFDILGRIVELLRGEDLDLALRHQLFEPLGMVDTTFVLHAEQEGRLVGLYEYENGELWDNSASEGARAMLANAGGLYSGGAGLFSTVVDYDRFAQMLGGRGQLDGVRVVSAESVDALTTERSSGARTFAPGIEWGLGVIVATAASDTRARGAWGWSGAWGGHLVLDPRAETSLVLMINRSNIGGADSYVSRRLEWIAKRAYHA